jgi:hypothetical protein
LPTGFRMDSPGYKLTRWHGVSRSLSPFCSYYPLLCGKEREALNVLSALEELPTDHEDVRREVLLVKNTVLRLAGGSSFSGMFTMGKERHLHRVILAGKFCEFPYRWIIS